ncbi:hypothetical protein MKX03_018892 [Papaver bracteatum]|nr:hypothetical protein MKX03_018892 [Papaver bracteatum]
MSYQVLTVKGLTEKKQVEATEKNGVENLKYEASLAVAGAQCGSSGCCRSVRPRIVPTCVRCCP